MPSITEIEELVRPIIDDAVRQAALEERRHILAEMKRALDRGTDMELWWRANVELLEATDQL